MNVSRIAALLLALNATLPATAGAQMKPPVPMTRAQFEGSSSGEAVQIVVRVIERRRDALRAEFLERVTDSSYRATGVTLLLYFPEDTPIIMGASSDVTRGAVLFVDGIATKHDGADVKKVTVVTRYVSVRH